MDVYLCILPDDYVYGYKSLDKSLEVLKVFHHSKIIVSFCFYTKIQNMTYSADKKKVQVLLVAATRLTPSQMPCSGFPVYLHRH